MKRKIEQIFVVQKRYETFMVHPTALIWQIIFLCFWGNIRGTKQSNWKTEKWLHCQNFATNPSILGKTCQQKKSAGLTFVFLSDQCLGRFLWNWPRYSMSGKAGIVYVLVCPQGHKGASWWIEYHEVAMQHTQKLYKCMWWTGSYNSKLVLL